MNVTAHCNEINLGEHIWNQYEHDLVNFGERVKSRKDCIVFCFAVCIFDNVLLW